MNLIIMHFVVVLLLASSFLCLYRLIAGPTGTDRYLCILVFTLLAAGFLCVYSIIYQSEFLLDMTLDAAILMFVGTLAISKYLQGKDLDE